MSGLDVTTRMQVQAMQLGVLQAQLAQSQAVHLGRLQARLGQVHAAALRTIADACCAVAGITLLEFLGGQRTPHLVRTRWAATLLARELTRQSLPAIGRAFNRDHSTLIHGYRRAVALLAAGDRDFTAQTRRARALLQPTTTEGQTR